MAQELQNRSVSLSKARREMGLGILVRRVDKISGDVGFLGVRRVRELDLKSWRFVPVIRGRLSPLINEQHSRH